MGSGVYKRVAPPLEALPQDVLVGLSHTYNGEWKTVFGQENNPYWTTMSADDHHLFRRLGATTPMPANDGNGPGGEKELLSCWLASHGGAGSRQLR